MFEAIFDDAEWSHATRAALLYSVRKESKRIVAFAAQDRELTLSLGEAILKEVAKDRPALDKLLREPGVETR